MEFTPGRARAISHNTWIHHIARSLVRPLAGTPVTPSHLTTLRLATGVAAAGAFAVGESPWQHVGGGLFLVSMVLDRADGELARLTGATSARGHAYDLIADAVSNALVLAGIGVGLRESALGLWAIPMGLLAGVSVAAILGLVMAVEDRVGQGAAELKSFAGFDVDDATLAIPIAVWLGWSVPLILSAAVVAPVVAAYFFWRFRAPGGNGGRRMTP